MTKQVLIEAVGVDCVGYFNVTGRQIGRGYPVEERPANLPTGTVYEQEYTLLRDVSTDDGELIDKLDGFPLKVGPRTFLRGRVVTDPKEAGALLMPSSLRRLVDLCGADWAKGEVEFLGGATIPTVVAVKTADGTEVGVVLQDNDVRPPAGASPYPVGESPEELAEADAKADPEWEDFDDEEETDEVAQIREDAKDGVYEDAELVAEEIGGASGN